MQIINDVKTIEDFIKKIDFIKQNYAQYNTNSSFPFLYRGQLNKKWNLETTLERNCKNISDLKTYIDSIMQLKDKIEKITRSKWNDNNAQSINHDIPDFSFVPFSFALIAYLRQIGVASPLLDWTVSPFVALYFAFEQNINEDPAVYVFIQTKGNNILYDKDDKFIRIWNPDARTHALHYVLQSWYTTAVEKNNNNVKFIKHEEYFNGKNRQEELIKIILPRNIRKNVLEYLDLYNINSVSLVRQDVLLKKYFE